MGKFAVKQGKTGFRFNLVAGNGQTIGTSEIYTTKSACLNGCAAIGRAAPKANVEDQTQEGFTPAKCPKFEIYTDKAGEFRFRLKAVNGEVSLASEGYKAMKSCLNGVESVRKNADSPVEIEE